MSTRSLATFLHRLLVGECAPIGPVRDSATLARLVEQPAEQLQALLGAQIDTLLAGWPGSGHLRPHAIPSAALWVAAALNNLAWAVGRPDPRLLTVTLRLVQALPPANDPAAALAYHSVLQHLASIDTPQDWKPVVQQLLTRSPLTAIWLPRLDEHLAWDVALALVGHAPVQAALRDRWLALLPDVVAVRYMLSSECAELNVEIGLLLAALLKRGDGWQPFVLAFYEADCAMQRRGSLDRPVWPTLALLGAMRSSPHA